MMKRLISALLAALMIFGTASALAAAGDMTLLTANLENDYRYQEAVGDIAVIGDTLYVLRGNEIDTVQAGSTELVPYITGLITQRGYYQNDTDQADLQHVVSRIFCWQDSLLCLNTINGSVFTVRPNDAGNPVYGDVITLQLDEEKRVQESGFVYLDFYFEEVAVTGNSMLVSGYDDNTGRMGLFCFDLTTGAMHTVENMPEQIRTLAPYKDGKLLMIAGEQDDFYDGEKNEYRAWPLSVYDPADDSLTELARVDGLRYYDAEALCYDAAEDVVYIAAPNKIFRLQDGVCQLAAYHPISSLYGEGAIAALFAGQIALYDNDGNLMLRTPDPAQLPTETLCIAGYYSSDRHNRAAAAMQDVPIFFTREGYFNTAQELGQALAAGENQLDIITVSLDWMDFNRLMDKGYCYDLSGSSVLRDYVNDLYPFIADAVRKDGKLYAIPIEINGSYWQYNEKTLQELGLTPPTTFAELAALMNDFASDTHENWWEEYTLFSDEGVFKDSLFYKAMEDYEQYVLSSGRTLSLDTPEFRAMMQAIEEMDLGNVELSEDELWDDEGNPSEEMEALWEKTELFQTYGDLYLGNQERNWQPLRLRVSEDASFALPVSVTVMFVNPRSANLEAAVRYLENLVRATEEQDLIKLSPNHNDPVINKNYEQTMKLLQENLARTEKQLAEADPIDKPDLQESVDWMKEYIEEFKTEGQYSVKAEAIEAYRALMESAVLRCPSVIYSNSNDDSFWTLRQRYLDGQITLDQFIQEGSGKLRLMQMENQ